GLYQAEEQRFDCGWLDQEAFINVAGVGFDAAVCAAQERRWRFLPGSISYVAAVLDALVHLRPSSITLKLDDTVLERQALLVAIANGQTFGGGMVIAPEARPDDGLLDVILVGPLSRSAFMRFFPLVYRGQHVNHPAVEVWRARRIEITASPAMPCQAEGEAMGYTPTLVQVEPGVIPFLIPRPSPGPP
ncbi:MAG: sphingosine kinase, partial [Firmicutes bacterium]|nr:sphingosine kinase [Bacillota bacterium]